MARRRGATRRSHSARSRRRRSAVGRDANTSATESQISVASSRHIARTILAELLSLSRDARRDPADICGFCSPKRVRLPLSCDSLPLARSADARYRSRAATPECASFIASSRSFARVGTNSGTRVSSGAYPISRRTRSSTSRRQPRQLAALGAIEQERTRRAPGTERVVASDRVRVPVIAGHDDLLRLQARVRGFVRPLARQERRASTPRERVEALLLFALPELARLAVPRLLVRVGEILRRAQARRASLVLVPGDGLARGDSGVALLRLRLAALLERDLVPAPARRGCDRDPSAAPCAAPRASRDAPRARRRRSRARLGARRGGRAGPRSGSRRRGRGARPWGPGPGASPRARPRGARARALRTTPRLRRPSASAGVCSSAERRTEARAVAAALERLEADVLELGRLARRIRGRDGPLGVLEGWTWRARVDFFRPGGARPRGFENEERARRRAGGPGRTPPVPGSDRARRRGARPTSEARSRRARARETV